MSVWKLLQQPIVLFDERRFQFLLQRFHLSNFIWVDFATSNASFKCQTNVHTETVIVIWYSISHSYFIIFIERTNNLVYFRKHVVIFFFWKLQWFHGKAIPHVDMIHKYESLSSGNKCTLSLFDGTVHKF